MKKLTNKQMAKIEGGVNWALLTIVTSTVSFVLGIINGIVNPEKCNT